MSEYMHSEKSQIIQSLLLFLVKLDFWNVAVLKLKEGLLHTIDIKIIP